MQAAQLLIPHDIPPAYNAHNVFDHSASRRVLLKTNDIQLVPPPPVGVPAMTPDGVVMVDDPESRSVPIPLTRAYQTSDPLLSPLQDLLVHTLPSNSLVMVHLEQYGYVIGMALFLLILLSRPCNVVLEPDPTGPVNASLLSSV